jgi:hypothetical protein
MFARSLVLAAFVSLGSIGVAMPADVCCECAAPCAPAVVVKAPRPADGKPFYVVDQGPVYGGPHIVTTPTFEPFHTRRYPAMRQTYYYPTYRDSYLLPPWHKPWQSPRP